MNYHKSKDWGMALKDWDAIAHRQKEPDELLPWDFIDQGYTKDYLWEEYQKGMKEKLSRYCGLPGCALCGLC